MKNTRRELLKLQKAKNDYWSVMVYKLQFILLLFDFPLHHFGYLFIPRVQEVT